VAADLRRRPSPCRRQSRRHAPAGPTHLRAPGPARPHTNTEPARSKNRHTTRFSGSVPADSNASTSRIQLEPRSRRADIPSLTNVPAVNVPDDRRPCRHDAVVAGW